MNISEAKDYYQSMGCSHFHMSRENFSKYDAYTALEISKEQELEWRSESIDQLRSELSPSAINPRDLWAIHSRMSDMVIDQKTLASLRIMIESTEAIEDRLSPQEKVIVSETINGRSDFKYKDGLIFLSLELNDRDIAKRFSDASLRLGQSAILYLKDDFIDRCKKTIERTERTLPYINK